MAYHDYAIVSEGKSYCLDCAHERQVLGVLYEWEAFENFTCENCERIVLV